MSDAPFDFKAARHVAAFSCAHVMSSGAPLLYVSHDAEGDWQFLCGAEHTAEEGLVVGLGHMVELDPSTEELASLCANHYAERASKSVPWTVIDRSEAFIRKCVESPG